MLKHEKVTAAETDIQTDKAYMQKNQRAIDWSRPNWHTCVNMCNYTSMEYS